jgi:hypothetical protein
MALVPVFLGAASETFMVRWLSCGQRCAGSAARTGSLCDILGGFLQKRLSRSSRISESLVCVQGLPEHP